MISYRHRRLRIRLNIVVALLSFLSACGDPSPTPTANQVIDDSYPDNPYTGTNNDSSSYKVFTVNRRGMAFPDNDFSISAIFPPANFVVAQVVKTFADARLMPELLDNSRIELQYSAVADQSGSINTISSTKTNFWEFANPMYDFYLWSEIIKPDQGFYGETTIPQWMPGVDNVAQRFSLFDAGSKTWTALYIPITPVDDSGNKNYFPLYRIDAVDKATQQILASTVIPLPMAEPMMCSQCHATGNVAADDYTSQRYQGIAWSTNPDPDNNAKENIALLHGAATGLDIIHRAPYLCAECHYSPIADPDGKGPIGDHQTRRRGLSVAIHSLHGLDRNKNIPASNDLALIPENGEINCKICHGREQPYLRGAMHKAGMVCQNCHGGMIAVGKSPLVGATETRTAFIEEPRCESCHTGDEVSHLGTDLVFDIAYSVNDPFAAPRIAQNRRFAEQPGTLYRNSLEHGAMTCLSCHGSPHAIWPTETDATHDNNVANQLQGHKGTIIECDACHAGGLALSMKGPHGLHNINDNNWVLNHGSFVDTRRPSACRACHGLDLLGGRLAKAAAARAFTLSDGRVINYSQGQLVGCTDCHGKLTR